MKRSACAGLTTSRCRAVARTFFDAIELSCSLIANAVASTFCAIKPHLSMGKIHLATAPACCLSGCTCRLPQRIRPNILAFGGLADGFLPFDTAPGKPKVELHLASVVMKAVQARVHGGQQYGCMPCSGKVGDDTNAAKAQVYRCLNCVHVPASNPRQVSRAIVSLLVTAMFHWGNVAFRLALAKLTDFSWGRWTHGWKLHSKRRSRTEWLQCQRIQTLTAVQLPLFWLKCIMMLLEKASSAARLAARACIGKLPSSGINAWPRRYIDCFLFLLAGCLPASLLLKEHHAARPPVAPGCSLA